MYDVNCLEAGWVRVSCSHLPA